MSKTALAKYRAKRNFSATTEPNDKNSVAASTRRRFVIQKHAARRLHYDLRLELDGVFKSWAVTRGPSLDPADKRLAVEVEDHPLAYGDFEGVIPTGQYGAGTVQLWDRGFWQPELEQSPRKSLQAGELKFSLDGQRLRGRWVLIRMQGQRDKQNNWLLIKHRETESSLTPKKKQLATATAALMKMDQSVASGRSMAQIAAGAGSPAVPFMTERSGEDKGKAVKSKKKNHSNEAKRIKRWPLFVEPQLCKLLHSPPSGNEYVHEVKLDGYRLQLRCVDGKVTLRTRKGLDWTNRIEAIAVAAARLPNCIIDGELVALDKSQHSSFSALQVALSENRIEKLVFFAFDLLFIGQSDIRSCALLERKRQLKALLDMQPEASALRYLEHLHGEGKQVWESACKMKLEGIISKLASAPYQSGRSAIWTKSKCRAGQEVVIGGLISDGNQIRSLLAGVMRRKKLIYVGRVGTGFNAHTSKMILPRLKALAVKTNPFHGMLPATKQVNVQWLKPQLVAEIEFAGWTDGGMVRQAAFKGLRTDKPATEIQAELPAEVAQTMPAVMKTKRSKSNIQQTKRSSSFADVITHPDKELWPATANTAAVTKMDLADYFYDVANWMLNHIQGRPCSIIRAPNGINQETFFQRHAMPRQSSLPGLIKVKGDSKPYLKIESSEALIAVAQLAGIELHPWNCMPENPELPGRLVFDLDPAPDVKFEQVIKAAIELRQRLQQLGLESFCKTTGGKGLHLVAPLITPHGKHEVISWNNAKVFAHTLCVQMAADSPSHYLVNMSKAARTGRIFLDYLRNDRMATAIAPLSPRVRAGAPVSMPLQWTQVKHGLDPMQFTLRTAMKHLKKQHPWNEYSEAARSLADAARLLQVEKAA